MELFKLENSSKTITFPAVNLYLETFTLLHPGDAKLHYGGAGMVGIMRVPRGWGASFGITWCSGGSPTGNPGGSPWVGAEVPAGGGDASGVSPGCQPRCLLTAPRGPGAALGAREPSSPRVRCPQEGRNSWGTGRGHLRTSSLYPRGPWPRCSCQAGQEGWTPPLSSAGKGPKGFLYGLINVQGSGGRFGAALLLRSGTC